MRLLQRILIVFCMILYLPAFSQVENMVLNPDCEKYYECPQGYTYMDKSHRLIPHWTYPTFTTPDYFNRCSKSEVRVPNNFAGYSQPKSGNGYLGAILTGSNKDFREYMQGTLSKPMVAGQRYCVSFWYKLASGSKFAVDQLSVFFSDSEVANGNKTYLDYKAHLNNKAGLFLDNTEEWLQFCQIYTAKGGERFFLVGNFKNYEDTNYVVTGKNTKNKKGKKYAYYYFDDFAIRPLVDCGICACVDKGMETVVIQSSYTGGVDPITRQLVNDENDGIISLGISGGTPPYNITWSNGEKNVRTIKNLSAGKYTYQVSDQNNCKSTGTIVFEKPKAIDDPFKEGLKNVEEGTALVLNNIFFETAKSTLLPESFPELNKVADFLKETSIRLIEISGHTDSDGSNASNQKLSQNRAQAVVNYLISKSISASRLKAVGYGENRPIDTNKTAEGKKNNRRVEFLVIKQ